MRLRQSGGRTLLASCCLLTLATGCGDPANDANLVGPTQVPTPRIVRIGDVPAGTPMHQVEEHWLGALEAALRLPEPFQSDTIRQIEEATGWKDAGTGPTSASLKSYLNQNADRVALYMSGRAGVIVQLVGRYHYVAGHQLELRDDGVFMLQLGQDVGTRHGYRGTWTLDGLNGKILVRNLGRSGPWVDMEHGVVPESLTLPFDLKANTITLAMGDEMAIAPVLQRIR